MIRFECDYAEGAHNAILQRLIETNMEQTHGYSEDKYCDQARKLIKQACCTENAEVHFLVGGTQTNTVVIKSILRPHQGVICAETGHINVHETGAIEATGHKVLTLPSADGKLTAAQIEQCYNAHHDDVNFEHIVQPGMVYISFPTENGTLYSKHELEEISSTCKRLQLPLYVDGARMGYGLMAPGNDLSLADFARLTDVFYIGGTKVGALFGEAVVWNNLSLTRDFRYLIKQHGALLAKGRLLGLQFATLFTDNLYFDISAHAIRMAMRIRDAFTEAGIPFLFDSYTNQQYPILSHAQAEKLSADFAYAFWCDVDPQHIAVRFCTSWATQESDVDTLVKAIKSING